MKTVTDIFLIALLTGLFGFLHSFLASNKVKKNIAEKTGGRIAFYRLFYNAVAVISILAVLEISPKPDQIIYELNYPYDIAVFILQALSLAGVVWSFVYTDWMELFGLSQVVRYYKGTYNTEDMDAAQELSIRGPYKISRHPLYLFFILFLGFRPYMDLFYLVIFISSVIYVFAGVHYEEKKLIEKFGGEYIEYTKNVSKIFPLKFKLFRDKRRFVSS